MSARGVGDKAGRRGLSQRKWEAGENGSFKVTLVVKRARMGRKRKISVGSDKPFYFGKNKGTAEKFPTFRGRRSNVVKKRREEDKRPNAGEASGGGGELLQARGVSKRS